MDVLSALKRRRRRVRDANGNETRDPADAKKPRNPEKNRPNPNAFYQQQLEACKPILTFRIVAITGGLVGVLFVPLGIWMIVLACSIQALTVDLNNATACPLNSKCNITFDWPGSSHKNVFFSYELHDYPASHRRFTNGGDWRQLRPGGDLSEVDKCVEGYNKERDFNISESECKAENGDWKVHNPCEKPFSWIGNFFYRIGFPLPLLKSCYNTLICKWYYAPCGAKANAMYNDTFRLFDADGEEVPWTFEGLLHDSEAEQFGHPPRRVNESLCDAYNRATIKPKNWNKPVCKLDPTNEENTGFRNFDFIVWMRHPASPTFRKAYRRLRWENATKYAGGLPAGCYSLEFTNNYNVSGFGGTKFFHLTTTSLFGGDSTFLGVAYIVTGVLCLLATAALVYRHHRWGQSLYDIGQVPLSADNKGR